MDRRQFRSAAAASLASEVKFARDKPGRAGPIGCGCYVDKAMLSPDYREMLEEKDLDIVLVATLDRRHARAMIAVVEAQQRV